ncbi:ribosome binding protein, putative [Babesia ovata]|uniref:Ribosome binding protein, putative n=1 Tax=Babesia ovata TaxID=189622 RepID=A0A2H6K8R2_9APIC|nr:ribosome binding protein, putative [Babesia ovata]GBE59384.1 ribosome binding protein, putative [Babesia ovata]
MAEGGNRFYFTSLRDCFIFFDWLETEKKDKLSEVAKKLQERLRGYYKNVDLQIESALSTFLSNVCGFYYKLVKPGVPENVLVGTASIKKDATLDDTVDALFGCLPKFLSALYFLLYQVDIRFGVLGGTKWRDDNPGYIMRWSSWRDYGGELNKYLYEQSGSKYGGVIPGGFRVHEVRYGYNWDGYRYGYSMATDLKNIFGKVDDQFFRDVFATSVLATTSGTQISNTANALALVNLFCEIVVEADENGNGDEFKTHVQLKNGCVHWGF